MPTLASENGLYGVLISLYNNTNILYSYRVRGRCRNYVFLLLPPQSFQREYLNPTRDVCVCVCVSYTIITSLCNNRSNSHPTHRFTILPGVRWECNRRFSESNVVATPTSSSEALGMRYRTLGGRSSASHGTSTDYTTGSPRR